METVRTALLIATFLAAYCGVWGVCQNLGAK